MEPDVLQVERWKRQHGAIFKLNLSEGPVVYRTLSISEYRTLEERDHSIDAQEWSIKQTLLYPDSIEKFGEESLSRLFQDIYGQSAFADAEQINFKVEQAREKFKSDLWRLVCIFIMKSFPQYTLESLESLPDDKLIEIYIMAEQLTGDEILSPTKLSNARKLGLTPNQGPNIPQDKDITNNVPEMPTPPGINLEQMRNEQTSTAMNMLDLALKNPRAANKPEFPSSEKARIAHQKANM